MAFARRDKATARSIIFEIVLFDSGFDFRTLLICFATSGKCHVGHLICLALWKMAKNSRITVPQRGIRKGGSRKKVYSSDLSMSVVSFHGWGPLSLLLI